MKHLFISLLITMMSVLTSNSMNAQDVVDHSGHPIAKELRIRWQAFIDAWHEEDAHTLAAFYTSEGWNIPPGGNIKKGRQQIQDFYQGLFDANRSSQYSVEILSLDGCDQDVIETGQFSVQWVRNDDSTWIFRARTVTHWSKAEDGRWYIRTFIYNNPPRD